MKDSPRSVARLLSALVLLVATGAGAPLAAQKLLRYAVAPSGVVVTGSATQVTVAWTPVAVEATYRVLRSTSPTITGTDIGKPVTTGSMTDMAPAPGTTYYYQVIAVYADGSAGKAAPVAFTVPASLATISVTPLLFATRLTTNPPTAVTGIKVSGTLASVDLAWLAVPGAVSYSVSRTVPGSSIGAGPTGLTTTSWTDLGNKNIGFPVAGVYQYQVTALLGDGTSVSGLASWTRPAPTCAPPAAGQQMLTVLAPTAANSQFTMRGPYPSGAVFLWSTTPSASGVAAYLVERSVQGTNTWTPAGTSCGGGPSPIANGASGYSVAYRFIDGLGGVVPGTVYLYRVTALAANGEAGATSVPWTAPTLPVVHWLAAAASGNTVTLNWRYEPPGTNAPLLPGAFKVTGPAGFTKTVYNSCTALGGCSLAVQSVPSGTQTYTVTAAWGLGSTQYNANIGVPVTTMSATTTVIVP